MKHLSVAVRIKTLTIWLSPQCRGNFGNFPEGQSIARDRRLKFNDRPYFSSLLINN